MDKLVKKRWVRALRSGRYRQIRGHLRNGCGGFCALGVLCELARRDGLVENYGDIGFTGSQNTTSSVLPRDVADWAGCSTSPSIQGASIMELNDDSKLPFNEIADLIEQYPVEE